MAQNKNYLPVQEFVKQVSQKMNYFEAKIPIAIKKDLYQLQTLLYLREQRLDGYLDDYQEFRFYNCDQPKTIDEVEKIFEWREKIMEQIRKNLSRPKIRTKSRSMGAATGFAIEREIRQIIIKNLVKDLRKIPPAISYQEKNQDGSFYQNGRTLREEVCLVKINEWLDYYCEGDFIADETVLEWLDRLQERIIHLVGK